MLRGTRVFYNVYFSNEFCVSRLVGIVLVCRKVTTMRAGGKNIANVVVVTVTCSSMEERISPARMFNTLSRAVPTTAAAAAALHPGC